ncbi:MAG: molybdopterin molybdenumtransferase MoeA [Gemmatimonadetes bacterium]|nr:MAG: molybdopterin molybdenumtransferase MoeA [Gemmatimonadota bacterium]
MITVNEAKQIILEHQPKPNIEQIRLEDAFNRILAEDIEATEPSPRFTNSAMDGFALRWADVQQVPVTLKIIGESAAGRPFTGKIEPEQAIRINTGAEVPADADCVVPVEDTQVTGDRVTLHTVKKQYQNIRFQGEEYQPGDRLISRGSRLNPARIGLLASLGIPQVAVFSLPPIAIVTTGTELVPYDAPIELASGQIRDSNSLTLKAAVTNAGGTVCFTGHAPDTLTETIHTIEQAEQDATLILFCGGVSVGEHDHVKPAAQQCGYETLFWKVKQKPGKPLFVAKKGGKLFFGLPGNPVSALICFLVYVQPVITHLTGQNPPPALRAKMAHPLENKGRPEFIRVALKDGLVYPLRRQNSNMLTTLSEADGFIFVDEQTRFEAGETVEITRFPWER